MTPSAAPEITRAQAWVLAARPKTLTAALAPVVVGTALAAHDGVLAIWPAFAALVGATLIQVGTNFANDYYDFVRGGDTADRVGPPRVTQTGILARATVKRGMWTVRAAALLVGTYLVWVGGWPIVWIGLSSLACAVLYTGGPFPLAYHALGDVFVFVFFGLVAVSGTYYVQGLSWPPDIFLAGAALGALNTAILVANNLRDIETDAKVGERALAVRIGTRSSQVEYLTLLLVAAVVPVVGWLVYDWPAAALAALLVAPLCVAPVRRVLTHTEPVQLLPALGETARDPKAGRYSASKGSIGLRRAMAGYYERRFGVKLNPDTEVISTLGSKEGFANLAQALTAPGDVIICPNPAYPIHAYGFIMAGGVIRHVPALSPEEYLSGVSRAVKHSAPPPSVLILSYPSNPTAQWVDLDFYKDAVALARKHDLRVLSDIAYSEIYFEDNPPPSVLQVEGAKEIAVEVNSLSKTYAMAGWRVGMVVGNERMCAALARVKSYLDYGAYTPIQVAAAAALNGPQDCVAEIRAIYKSRRDTLVRAMKQAGWDIPAPPASMFAWAPLPEQYKEAGSMQFAKLLIEEAGVAVAPGVAFGEYGEGYVRIGLVENEHRIRQAARNVRRFLANSEEILGRAHNSMAAQ